MVMQSQSMGYAAWNGKILGCSGLNSLDDGARQELFDMRENRNINQTKNIPVIIFIFQPHFCRRQHNLGDSKKEKHFINANDC